MPTRRGSRRALVGGIVALAAWGAWSNAALATWIDQLKNPGFTAWRYELDDVLFGDPAPGIVALDRTAPVPRDGIVAIDGSLTDAGACGALYIAEQGKWVALERPEGAGRQLTGRLAAAVLDSGSALIAGGEDWSASASREPDGRWRITLDSPGGVTTSDPVPLDPAHDRAGRARRGHPRAVGGGRRSGGGVQLRHGRRPAGARRGLHPGISGP